MIRTHTHSTHIRCASCTLAHKRSEPFLHGDSGCLAGVQCTLFFLSLCLLFDVVFSIIKVSQCKSNQRRWRSVLSFIFLSLLHHFVGRCIQSAYMRSANSEERTVKICRCRRRWLLFFPRMPFYSIFLRMSRATAVNFCIVFFLSGIVSLMEKLLNRFRFEFDVNVNKR